MESAFSEIFAVHSHRISGGERMGRSTLVVFSAVPGSGKSELTKRMVRDFGYVGIANRDIREAMELTGHTKDVSIGEYTLWLFDKLTRKSHVNIVFDRNIDQWYDPVRDWTTRNHYHLITVAIDVTREKLRMRLMEREGPEAAKVLGVLDFYSEQHETMKPKIVADVTLLDDYSLDNAARQIAAC